MGGEPDQAQKPKGRQRKSSNGETTTKPARRRSSAGKAGKEKPSTVPPKTDLEEEQITQLLEMGDIANQIVKEGEKLVSPIEEKTQSVEVTEEKRPLTNDLSTKSPYRRGDVDRMTSIKNLRKKVEALNEPRLKNLLVNHSFLGWVDHRFVLMQHNTYVYKCNMQMLTQQLFYQIALENFGNYGTIQLNPPASIRELAKLALDDTTESGWTEADGDKSSLAKYVVDLIKGKAEMLSDYYSLEIDSNGNLCSIPKLMEGYIPFLGGLPNMLLRLSTEVNWEDEQACFDNLCQELARFYSIKDDKDAKYGFEQHYENLEISAKEECENKWKAFLDEAVWPALKMRMKPPKSCATDQTFVQVANLSDHTCYRVFERC